MIELTEAGRSVIDALLSAPIAWRTPEELARAIGQDQESTLDVLAGMDAGGWLAAWDRPDDLVVTLSVAAASMLEVRLVEVGVNQTLRWARRTAPDPPPLKAPGVFRNALAATLERVIDDRPGPLELDAARPTRTWDSDKARDDVQADLLPRPTLLVGTGLSPWPGPGDGRKASCPACRSRRLGPLMYCLCCDRWGQDHLLGDGVRVRVSKPIAREAEVRLTNRARQARKAKRMARRLAQNRAGAKARPDRRKSS